VSTDDVIAALDRGEVRVAEPDGDGWKVNADVQAAILDYFRERQLEPEEVGPFAYHDKIPLKTNYDELGVRVVPPRSVVVPGTRPKEFPAGTYHLSCALIIGRRNESTDLKTSLNDALRDHSI